MQTVHLKLYNSNDTYMSPSGAVMDYAKVLNDFPAVTSFTFIVETDDYEEMMYGFYSLSAMKSRYNIDSSLSDVEAVEAIEDAMNAEREEQEQSQQPSDEVTPDERIAAALEYQVLNSMEDA